MEGIRSLGRSSRAVADKHRQELVDAASRVIRDQGLRGYSISDVMTAGGLTRGGFYRHFESKDALEGEAVERAFEHQTNFLERLADGHRGDRPGAVTAYIDFYLGDWHQHNRGQGCPVAALSGEIARERRDSPARVAFIEGIQGNIDLLTTMGGDGSASTPEEREDALVILAAAVGAAVLSRATQGEAISDEITAAVKKRFAAPVDASAGA